MNAKKVKAIRRELRAQGVDVRQKQYAARDTKKTIKMGKGFANVIRTTIILTNCGRALYKQAKAAAVSL